MDAFAFIYSQISIKNLELSRDIKTQLKMSNFIKMVLHSIANNNQNYQENHFSTRTLLRA